MRVFIIESDSAISAFVVPPRTATTFAPARSPGLVLVLSMAVTSGGLWNLRSDTAAAQEVKG